MSMQLDSLPSATTLDIETLVHRAWQGRIRVPRFQRDFRWHHEDVRRLFDSIVRGYPIGSLLLWVRQAEAKAVRLGVLDIEAPESTEALWVVDGQQRITSLANALHPEGAEDPRFALAYDLVEKRFVRPAKNAGPTVVPLHVLFDLQKLIFWFNEHQEIKDFLDQASRITRSLRQYAVPVYQVQRADPVVLQDIFDRMNNYGKRLTRAEVFNALHREEGEGEGEQNGIDIIAARIATEHSFGTIDGNTVLQSVLAPRGADVKRAIQEEFRTGADRREAYDVAERALRKAVEFLQRDAGVPHFTMLAYHYLLPPLVRLFALHPEIGGRNRLLLRRWYWRAAVAGPQQFKAGTGDAARLLCARVDQDLTGSIQQLLETVQQQEPVFPGLSGFATNQAATKIVLCSWWALKPRDPETGLPYEAADLATPLVDQRTARSAVRYLAPNRAVPKSLRAWAANRVLMPVVSVDSQEAGQLLVDVEPDVEDPAGLRRSHLVDDAVIELLRSGAHGGAVEARQVLIEQHLRDFLARMGEWNSENTPPLADLILDDEDDDGTE